MNQKRIGYLIGVCYCITFIYFLFFADFRKNIYPNVNLIPFSTIVKIIREYWNYDKLYIILNIGGNLFLLFPIPLFFNLKISYKKLLVFSFLLPIFIELIQYISKTGSADIDDVLLNSLGYILGCIFYQKTKLFLPKSESNKS